MTYLLDHPYGMKAFESLILVFVVIALARLANFIVAKRSKGLAEAPYLLRYSAVGVALLGFAFIWLESMGTLFTALTLVATGLTIVSKELILNFLGSFVIFWRELFSIGDRVEVGEFTGDVFEKGILYFTLLEVGGRNTTGHSTGRLVKVPNMLVMTLPVVNMTRGAGYLWNEIRVTPTPTSDWRLGREVLLSAAREYEAEQGFDPEKVRKALARHKVRLRKIEPIVYVSVVKGGICLTVRYLSTARLVVESRDAVMTRFLAELSPGVLELSVEQS